MRRLYPLLVTFLAFTGCSDPPKPEKAKDLDKIQPKEEDSSKKKGDQELGAIPSGPIAKVGDVEIPSAAFREIYDLKVKKYADRAREIPYSADRRYRKSIAERLIFHEILRQEANALGVELDEAALKEREEEQKRGIRDWEKHLERRGETDESLREMYAAELRERAILTKLGKLEVTEEEIQADYEKIKGNWKSDKPRVRASHILIPIGPEGAGAHHGHEKEEPAPSEQEKAKWEAEAKAKADALYKEVTAEGADFAKIAEAGSTGPSAAKGGDIGIFTADRMAEEFSEVAFKMNVGEISKPVKTKFGYHIIKVVGKWPEGELPREALEDQIVSRLQQRKLHQGRRELKEQLTTKYKVVDNIAPTLGPEPARPKPRSAQRDPHMSPMRKGAPPSGEHPVEEAGAEPEAPAEHEAKADEHAHDGAPGEAKAGEAKAAEAHDDHGH